MDSSELLLGQLCFRLKSSFLHRDNAKHVPSFSASTAAHSIPFHHSAASVPRAKLRPGPLFRQRCLLVSFGAEKDFFFSEQKIGRHFIVFLPILLLFFRSVIGRARLKDEMWVKGQHHPTTGCLVCLSTPQDTLLAWLKTRDAHKHTLAPRAAAIHTALARGSDPGRLKRTR